MVSNGPIRPLVPGVQKLAVVPDGPERLHSIGDPEYSGRQCVDLPERDTISDQADGTGATEKVVRYRSLPRLDGQEDTEAGRISPRGSTKTRCKI